MTDTNLMEMPGYRYAEYLLILNPHEELKEKILQAGKDMAEKYNLAPANLGKPHVTLARFIVWEMMEEKILNRLKVAAMGLPPFKMLLKDYGSFPSHTIFINIPTKIPVQELIKQVRTARQLMKSPEYDPYFNADPHITLARKLPHEQFDKAWLDYSHRQFTGSFIADAMLLLKRREGEKAWQIVNRFQFMNLPVTTRQGELFV